MDDIDGAPLIDGARLAAFSFFPAEKLRELLWQAMDAGKALAAAAQGESIEVLGATAHRVKGSCGTIGLARIAAIAGRLEEDAKLGGRDAAVVERLSTCLADTGAALREKGIAQP